MQTKKELYIVGVGKFGKTILRKTLDSGANAKRLCFIRNYSLNNNIANSSIKFIDLNNDYDYILSNIAEKLTPIGNKKIILIAGLGGNTSGYMLEKLTKKLIELQSDFYSIGTIPFNFEGSKKKNKAYHTVVKLQSLPNFKAIDSNLIKEVHSGKIGLAEAFNFVDNIILELINNISKENHSNNMSLN